LDKITIQTENPIRPGHLIRLREFLRDRPVLITTHANPDPDALESGKAIGHLIKTKWGIPTQLIYSGLVGRAENRAVLHFLTLE
jgi:nanoRNase/pAp phosphatase (c-di-AMP/oligoRNAs hydrolase)